MRSRTDRDGRRATAHTITDRRRRQATFPEAGERFRTSYADSPIGLALLTPDGRLFHANPALCRLLGATEPELIDRTLLAHVAVDDMPAAERALRPASPGAGLRSCSVRLETRDGGCRWADLTVGTMAARDGDPLLVVVHVDDRTAEVEALAALGHAERVAVAGRLASGVIHDVRNALAALRGRAELLAADLDDEGAVRSHLDSMNSAMNRMTSLTGQVLELTRPTTPRRELVDLAGIVSTFEAVARAQFGDRDRVQVDASQPVLLDVDPAEVERILLTLFSNAADAVASGGTIRITVSGVHHADGNGAGFLARLVVQDTGVGMDPRTAAHAFEPFFSTKGSAGTGLGLASAKSVVQSLGGSISIVSDLGCGTTVEVLLPAVGSPSEDEN